MKIFTRVSGSGCDDKKFYSDEVEPARVQVEWETYYTDGGPQSIGFAVPARLVVRMVLLVGESSRGWGPLHLYPAKKDETVLDLGVSKFPSRSGSRKSLQDMWEEAVRVFWREQLSIPTTGGWSRTRGKRAHSWWRAADEATRLAAKNRILQIVEDAAIAGHVYFT